MNKFDVTKPNAARMYDYGLGGKNNYQADRDAVEAILKTTPHAAQGAQQNRLFLRRALAYVAAQRTVHQFIDIGAGLPTQENTHQVVQKDDAGNRVLYVDHDPVVISHARVLLESDPGVLVLGGDLRDPREILRNEETRTWIDFTEPVCLVLVAVLHFLPDPIAREAVETLKEAVPPGSCLVLSHATADEATPDATRVLTDTYEVSDTPVTMRSLSEVERFFDGFTLFDPGTVNVADWHPYILRDYPLMCYGGVAWKP